MRLEKFLENADGCRTRFRDRNGKRIHIGDLLHFFCRDGEKTVELSVTEFYGLYLDQNTDVLQHLNADGTPAEDCLILRRVPRRSESLDEYLENVTGCETPFRDGNYESICVGSRLFWESVRGDYFEAVMRYSADFGLYLDGAPLHLDNLDKKDCLEWTLLH